MSIFMGKFQKNQKKYLLQFFSIEIRISKIASIFSLPNLFLFWFSFSISFYSYNVPLRLALLLIPLCSPNSSLCSFLGRKGIHWVYSLFAVNFLSMILLLDTHLVSHILRCDCQTGSHPRNRTYQFHIQDRFVDEVYMYSDRMGLFHAHIDVLHSILRLAANYIQHQELWKISKKCLIGNSI